MAHARQQIRDSVRDALADDPRLNTWRGPFTNRAGVLSCLDHKTRKFQPAIRISTPDDQLVGKVVNGAPIRGLALQIELVHRDHETADDLVDDAAVAVEQIMHGWEIPGITKVVLNSTTLDTDGDAEADTVSLVIAYSIDYRADPADPSVLLP